MPTPPSRQTRPSRHLPQRSKTTLGESEGMLKNKPKKKLASTDSEATEAAHGLKRWSEQVAALRALTSDLLLFFVLGIVVVAFLSIILPPAIKSFKKHFPSSSRDAEKVYERPVQITPFVVPEGLTKQGFTPDYLTKLLFSKLLYVNQVANRAAASQMSVLPHQHESIKFPAVETPSGKIDLGGLQEYVKGKYDPSPHIDGFVTQDSHFLTLTLVYNAENGDNASDGILVPLPCQDHTVSVKVPVSPGNIIVALDQAMMKATLQFEGSYRPLVAALYNYQVQSLEPNKLSSLPRRIQADLECRLCLQNAPTDDYLHAHIIRGLIFYDHYMQVNQQAGQKADLISCVQMFNKAIADAHAPNPERDDSLARFYLGFTLGKQKNYEEAVAQYERLPDDPQKWSHGLPPQFVHEAWASAIDGLATPEEVNAALIKYQQQLDRQPTEEEPKTFFYYGFALQKAGHNSESEHQFRLAIQGNPNDAGAYIYLASVLETEGRLTEALRECKLGLLHAPKNSTGKAMLKIIFEEVKF